MKQTPIKPSSRGARLVRAGVGLVGGEKIVAFFLTEDVASQTDVAACAANWDPSVNSGAGDYVKDATDTFSVRNAKGVFDAGTDGSFGWALVKQSDNGAVKVIIQLGCP